MKNLALIVLISIVTNGAQAQEHNATPEPETKVEKKLPRTRPARCPVIYLTISTGVNNNTAITGFSFDVPLSRHVSIEAGIGTGTWGNKIFTGARYYLKPCQRGFAFGAGLSYYPGVLDDHWDLETVNGINEPVRYNKNALIAASMTIHKYWTIGKRYNRFYVETGFSVPITNGSKITQTAGNRMSDKTIHNLNSGIQAGPIIALGFSFGFGH